MNILFINGSPNKNGNTAELAETLMNGKAYQTLELVDYKVYGYGQNFADDQFAEIVEQMKAADTIVIGSPVYWHNMSGMVRNLIDRFYGPVPSGALKGSGAGKVDAGKSRIHHEPFRPDVRHGVCGNGNKQQGSKSAFWENLRGKMSPVTDGSCGGAAVFTQIPGVSEGSPIEFTLKAVEQISDGGLYLNYLAKNVKQVG